MNLKNSVRSISTIQLSLLGLFLLATFASPLQAQNLPNFKAQFAVEALGMELGKAKHAFNCQNNQCKLVSNAKPEGLAALLFSDSAVETVQLQQNSDSLQWLSYHKLGTSKKDGKTVKKHTTLKYLKDKNQVIYIEKNRNWPAKPKTFDSISIAYAIQHAHLNQLAVNDFVLQDTNFQEKLRLKNIDKQSWVSLSFAEHDLDAVKYHFVSEHAEVEIWLLPKFNFFPGQVRVLNNDDKTITLSLAEPPEQL